ncbi:hypothetical protein Tel_12800 [Candidatus Tenderia electrophaga]|jgi:6-phosphofructokinase 2|uniref:Phosphofructokinase n=1 Tax=Candidatus Tenderia electrophaga TaxID=1748243 RepID=A0A0S2TFJ2_9GAMM|nr:hypothetical protein Tel_12800 [Candidatus Tenderia electrophaga]
MKPIATLTMNPAVDVIAEVEQLQPGKKLRSPSRTDHPGGGGINVARVIRRFGGEVRAVFPAGGEVGERLSHLLERENVQYHAVPVTAQPRQNFVVHVKQPDELYHFVMPGAPLSEAEAERCLKELLRLQPRPRYLVASGSLPPGVDETFYARVAHLAHRHDMRLILDTSGAPLRAALDEGIYLIKPNQREFADLAGEPLAEDETQRREQVAAMLAQGNMETLIVTLGEAGAILATPQQQIRVRPPAIKGVSPVGAGDSFVALLVLKLAQGNAMQEALGYAVAAAAGAVLTRGTELCRVQDVERIYEQMSHDDTAIQIHGNP